MPSSVLHWCVRTSANSCIQGAWDSYIQGTGANAMDPSAQLWPMNVDMPQMDAQPTQQLQNQQSQQQQSAQSGQSAPSGSGGVFMGATTPGASAMM